MDTSLADKQIGGATNKKLSTESRALEPAMRNGSDGLGGTSGHRCEEINLGKAAEMLGMHELELRDRFIELGIPLRIGPADKAEARAEAQALSSWFTQEDNTPTQ